MHHQAHSSGGGVTVRLLPLLLLAICCQLSAAAQSNPLKDPRICGRPQCEPGSAKFLYTDTLYKYDYSVQVRSEFSGTGDNTSDLIVKVNMDLMFPKPCEGYLRITDVNMWDKPLGGSAGGESESAASPTSDDTAYDYYNELSEAAATSSLEMEHLNEVHPKSVEMAEDLKRYMLRFAFHDGLIGEVCPDEAEPTWVLNFKKGILSTLQNTMLRFDVDFNTTETDVSGVCNVQYSLETTDNVYVTIRKVKDIGSCRQRYNTQSILQTTPYTFRDDKTIWPILDSESYCNMTIDRSRYKEVSCFERHQLIPFSNSSTGAVTTSHSKLEFKSEEPFSSSEFLAENSELIMRRSTLLFDHTPLVKPTHTEIKAARDHLQGMCAMGFPNIQREFIDVFTSFLQTTKSLDYRALSQLLARAEGICHNGKNHVLESLPYIASTASYQLMRDQIVANAIPKMLAHNWMTTLSFVQRPDEDTLDTFYTILEFAQRKTDPEYTLGATAVIHSFCRHTPDCGSSLRVQRIINLLEREFANSWKNYRGDRRQRERLIVVLKGLGNVGVISDEFAVQLQRIIAEEVAPVDLRLQAVQVFRRVDCHKYRQFFLDTYATFTTNSEVRIFAYLQAMRCPDYQSIGVIKEILQTEEINQVGSFVWSHLTNLAKSSSPVRIEAQGLLLNDDLSDKFKLDIRKFSRNYEHSLFFDEYNFGTTTDMNLIFATDSYLPRMSTLNFTADLFGQSVNLFEFSARAEGFEELVSSIFGPKGPLNRELFRKKFGFLNRWLGTESSESDDTLENLLSIDNLRLKRGAKGEVLDEQDEDDYEFEEDVHRVKRSPGDNAEQRKAELQQKVDDLGYKLKYNYDKPSAQIGMRIFGNDMRYYTLEGLLEVMAFAKEFDPFHQAKKILSGKEFTYTKSRVFLDASYNVPLSVGLPLAIHTFGASSVDLRISGNLDRPEPTYDWFFDIEGRFKPSVSVDVITTMKSDMFYAMTGIKVKSNLYSNSEVEAKLKVRGRNLVSFAFNLPQDKNEIFSARSELLVMKGDEDVPQAGIERRLSNSTCTWPVLDEAIGLKMCSYFSVPDLSNSSDVIYPSLLLSGPLNFSVVLTKSDVTAKKFVFEYKWDKYGNDTEWSFVFHTPGSSIKRLLVSNVTTVENALNATVAFENGPSRVSAGCKYDGNPARRKLDVFLDTNGNRSLDLNMELMSYKDRSAWVYKPMMLLAINGVNITGLAGVIRMNAKNGIVQNDFELSFETKKLQALIRGNLVQTEITTSTNMTINYRFQANKVETINFDGKLINTADKSKTEYRGNVKLKTSAYPKLNFASNGTWLSVQGHTEGSLTFNNAPNFVDPKYTSLVRVVFARSTPDDSILEGTRTRASFEVKVPRSKVDFRILVKHEERNKNGSEHNVIVGLRYAPEKEATGLFSILLPRRNLLAIDAYMNVTIPDFNSCTARLKLFERTPKDYMLNLNGSWFTGHMISIRGDYKDKSSRVQALHQMKLLIESPSFETSTVYLVYRRNQLVIFADVQAKYGKDPYALRVQYEGHADNKNSNAEVRLKVKEKEYWVVGRLLAEQPKLLEVEIHLDKVRDIQVKLGLLSLPQRKEISLEFKWDVNRDPTLRMGLLAEYNNLGNNNYDGNLMVTYPGRTISSGFNVYTGGPKYYGVMQASWSINDMMKITYQAGVTPGKHLHNWVVAEVTTPFEGWRKNSLQAGIYNVGNLLLANSSLLWADDQRLELGYKSDYHVAEPLISFDVRFGINSTIKDIPTINVKVQHSQDTSKYDTDLYLRYSGLNDTMNVYSIKSLWELYQDAQQQNVTGTIVMQSPFEGYRRGGLAARFSLNDQREIAGAASLTFDIREFTLAMDGYVKKYTDNMLTINITTPLEKFRTINARFGLNEKIRHAVAEVRAPAVALGAEVLADIKSLMNFDVKLSVATPIDTFKQAALFAKLKSDTIDMRGMWNNTTLGFIGVWRMLNITDFEYSYQVFTPLPNFEENGFIAKFVKRDEFVLNLYGKLALYKLGVKINGQPKSKLLKQLGGNKVELMYDDDFRPPQLDEDEDYDMNEVDYDGFFSYFVDFQVDTIVWPTVDGNLDIQEIMDYYFVVGNLMLPQGRVDIKDRLYYPDYINVLNVLNVQTPFAIAKEVKSIVEYHIDLDFNEFYEKIHFTVTDNSSLVKEAGFELNYTKLMDTLKPKQHDVRLTIKTPFELLPDLDIQGRLELEDTIYRGNISSKTANTYLSLGASVESEDAFLETSVGILLQTDVIPHYACNAYFKKDASDTLDSVDIQFEVTDNDTMNKLQMQFEWHTLPNTIIDASARIETTMLSLKSGTCAIVIQKAPDALMNFDLILLNREGYRVDWGARGNMKGDVVSVEVWTPMQNYKNISMHATMVPSGRGQYSIRGTLYRNMATYSLNGVSKTTADDCDVRLRIQPKSGGRDGVIEFSYNSGSPGDKAINVQFSAIEDGKMCQISGGYSVSDETGVDFSVLIESTEAELSRINIHGKLVPQKEKGHLVGELSLETPWRQLGIDSVQLKSDVFKRPDGGKVLGEYRIGSNIGRGSCAWSWVFGEDMQLALDSYIERPNARARIVHAAARYLNPDKNFQRLRAGGQLNVDSKWNLEVNGTMRYISTDDIEVGVVTKLPDPIGDVHHLGARYQGNLLSKQGTDPNVFVETKYHSEEAKRKFLSRVSYRNVTDLQGMGHVEWGHVDNVEVIEGDFQMLRKPEVRREFYAKLITPKFKDEDTLFFVGNYDLLAGEYHNLKCSFDYPSSRRIADVDVAFNSLSNMYGFVNSSASFINVTWFKADFNFTSTNLETYRYCHTEWPSDTAFFMLHSKYNKDPANHGLTGVIEMEVPLEERHRADIEYQLQEQPKLDKGYVKILHNKNQVLSGLYKRVEESSYPLLKQITDITIENDMKPLGVRYVKSQDFTQEPSVSSLEHLQVFELRNEAKFNLTGELHSKRSPTGDELKFVAIHPNRTVVLTVNYDEDDDRAIKQRSKLELSSTAWIGYNFEMHNLSSLGNDSQNFLLELSYPKRILSTEGWYYMTEEKFDSNIAFKWTADSIEDEKKVVRSGFTWESLPLREGDRDHQAVCLTLGHPYLEKEVTFKGDYYRGVRDLLKANFVIDYSQDPSHLIKLGAVLTDLYKDLGHTNYTFQMFGHHMASELEMQFNGSLAAKPSYYKTESNAFYKRDYYPEKHGKFLALLDLNRKELDYLRVSPYRTVRLWAMPTVAWPVYGLNATVWDSPDTNNTGYVTIDLLRKYARMEINLTEDASQNLQMVGYIPDTRSGYLDIWRNYEEIRIIDVTSYLKMNHSRLITGRFHWRPKIKAELKQKIRSVGESLYTSFSDGIDFWIKSLYSETVEAIGVIWQTAKDYNSQFLDDVGELSVLEEDLDDLRVFMNQSYEANDFYIKTVVNFTLTILDELAIRDHIESLPKIFTEIWQAMGDSGKALRKSIMWLIESIKTTYNHIIEAISRFFHGESLHYVSSLMEKGIEKYDKFVKDLHISFIKSVERMWNKFWNMMSDYWRGVLKRLEPHIFKFMSYIETTAWDLSKEVFDFIYKRTNELAESPYYNQVSSFSQDVDRLYKDIKSHDAITNIKKYTMIVWNFLKEKYFKLVPFGAELNEVLTEIWEEIKELRKIEQVQVVIQKYNEIVGKLEWLAEELQLESRLHQLYALLRNKFNHYALNALETADMYREAKTKFFFDPEVGVMDLEQKLPMSWHAFNETPKFEEIPEYKMLAQMQNLFSSTNSSMIRYIYSLRTHLDPKTWLPPYYSRALIVDSRHYMTFDKRFVGLNLNFEERSGSLRNAQCSYLLAHDFARRNFTLMLEPALSGSNADKVATRKLSFMANGQLLEIDLGNDSLTVNGNPKPFLPLSIGDVTIYRDLDVLTVHSDTEFSLQCNMQFDLCWFEVSGWYFGQTAGLLGTMNNEHFDEYMTAAGSIADTAEEFTDSWSVKDCKQKKKMLSTSGSEPVAERVQEVCQHFFKEGVLSACSGTVDVAPFYEMCLDLGANSNAVRDGHPSVKGACTAALAYIEACATSKIRLRVPDQCVYCELSNGSYVPEGSFVELKGSDVPRSSDVVFIVEAKPCNANLTQEKDLMTIVQTIEEQLQANRIKNNRYAVVSFGGQAPFDKPRSIIYENRVFTSDLSELGHYFGHIATNNGTNNDILQAISVATKLNFRPGVSKTFVLLSCSDCSAHHMRFDYSSILQYMLEEGVNLHILADAEFDFERTRKLRHFFGLDRNVVYSKRFPEGDAETRKQLHVSKNNLGICIPLALETGGSVFSARKLLASHKYPVKRFATIIGKRIAASAVPHEEQTCECSGHNTGVAYMMCSPAGSNDDKITYDDYGILFDEFNLDAISDESNA